MSEVVQNLGQTVLSALESFKNLLSSQGSYHGYYFYYKTCRKVSYKLRLSHFRMFLTFESYKLDSSRYKLSEFTGILISS